MKSWESVEADEDRILSVHFTEGRGGHAIDKIVIHHNGGELSIAGCYSVWQSRSASAHYQVQSDGRIGQLVWDTDTAWHCGDFGQNQRSIGIEHADCQSNPWRISDACLDNGAHLVAALCRYYGLGRPEWGRNLFGHSDFAPTECPASLAVGGAQHDAYVARCQYWYDIMTGAGTAPEEEEMQASDVWTYNWENTAPGGNMYNCLTYMYRNVEQLKVEVAALSEAVKALSASNGADPDKVAQTVENAVKAKLATIKLTVEDQEGA